MTGCALDFLPRMAADGFGVEWIVDATGCDAAALRSLEKIESFFARLIADLTLKPVVAPVFHQFPPPGGITGFVVLSESHLACHTYPEFGSATFNLYCCVERPEWNWREELAREFGACEIEITIVKRSIAR